MTAGGKASTRLSVNPAQQVEPKVILRDALPGDLPFVSATWLRHYRRRNAALAAVPDVTYILEQRALIFAILARSIVTVACDSADPSLIMGYVVSSGRTIHWLQVKKVFQRHGLGRMLAGTVREPLHWSHAADNADLLWTRYGMSMTYNPYKAWS